MLTPASGRAFAELFAKQTAHVRDVARGLTPKQTIACRFLQPIGAGAAECSPLLPAERLPNCLPNRRLMSATWPAA